MTKQEAILEFKKNTLLQIELYKEWAEYCSHRRKNTAMYNEKAEWAVYTKAKGIYKRNNQLIWKYQIQFIKKKISCGKYHVRWFYFPVEEIEHGS